MTQVEKSDVQKKFDQAFQNIEKLNLMKEQSQSEELVSGFRTNLINSFKEIAFMRGMEDLSDPEKCIIADYVGRPDLGNAKGPAAKVLNSLQDRELWKQKMKEIIGIDVR